MFEVVGLGRLELPTSPLSGVRSSQLSYRPSQSRPAVTSGLLTVPDQQRQSGFGAFSKGFEDTVERARQLRRL